MSVDTPTEVTNIHVDAPQAQAVQIDPTELDQAVTTIVKESKSGWRTTEFWVTVFVSLATLLNGIPLPEKYEGAVIGALAVAYALSRGLAKKGVPVVETPAAAVAPEDGIVQRDDTSA